MGLFDSHKVALAPILVVVEDLGDTNQEGTFPVDAAFGWRTSSIAGAGAVAVVVAVVNDVVDTEGTVVVVGRVAFEDYVPVAVVDSEP